MEQGTTRYGGEYGEFKLGKKPSEEQEKELQDVLLTYETVLQKVPGKTQLAEHRIPTN